MARNMPAVRKTVFIDCARGHGIQEFNTYPSVAAGDKTTGHFRTFLDFFLNVTSHLQYSFCREQLSVLYARSEGTDRNEWVYSSRKDLIPPSQVKRQILP